MTRQYDNFQQKEMSDGTYLVADPVQPNDEPLRMEGGWFDVEPGESGDWEEIVGAIVRNDLQQELQLQQDGRGTIERNRAIQNLIDSEFEQSETIDSEAKAAAVVDYFIEKGALSHENNDLVVLHNPNKLADDSVDTDGKREFQILSWAAAIDACIDYMDETLQTFEEAKDRIKDRLDSVEHDDVSKATKLKKEKLQELQNLGSGSGIPDPKELSERERKRFQDLKADIAYYDTMEEVGETELGAAQEAINELSRNIEKVKAAKEQYENKVNDIRTWGVERQIFPEGAIDIADNMAKTITALSGVEDHEKRAEELDVTDLRDMAEDVSEAGEEVADQVSESTGDEDLEITR